MVETMPPTCAEACIIWPLCTNAPAHKDHKDLHARRCITCWRGTKRSHMTYESKKKPYNGCARQPVHCILFAKPSYHVLVSLKLSAWGPLPLFCCRSVFPHSLGPFCEGATQQTENFVDLPPTTGLAVHDLPQHHLWPFSTTAEQHRAVQMM
jgi:hypothetical protein